MHNGSERPTHPTGRSADHVKLAVTSVPIGTLGFLSECLELLISMGAVAAGVMQGVGDAFSLRFLPGRFISQSSSNGGQQKWEIIDFYIF